MKLDRNSGGLSCVAGPDEVIYRTRTVSPDEPGFDRLAGDLRQLFDLLERSSRFIANYVPG
ncbi:hypothetical protein ABZ569_12765 [Streptomyces albus]|uniref:hypothetical protein n=1 Tax=Streptomyces albus TaxID=1888 RepID=UPI0033CF18B5